MRLLLFIGAFFYFIVLNAQPFQPQGKFNISAIESEFEAFKTNSNFYSQKGWKWQARWLEEQAKNTSLGNDFPNYEAGYFEYQNHTQTSKKLKRSNANWSPAGPVLRPPNANSYSNHGMGRINCIEFHPTDSNIFWVGVAQGGIWRTDNYGETYTPLNDGLPMLRISDIEVNPNNTQELYACVGDYAYIGVGLDLDDRKRHTHYGLGVYKSTDGGASWQPTALTFNELNRNNTLMRRVFVNPSNTQEIIAAGVEGIFKSYDGGNSFNQVLDSLIWDFEMNPDNPNTLIAVGGWVKNTNSGSACILKSTDFGDTWQLTSVPFSNKGQVQRVEVAYAADTNYLYAVGCDVNRGFYGFYQSIDGGLNWNTQFDQSDSLNILAWSDGIDEVGGQGAYDLSIAVDPKDKNKVFVGGVNTWGTDDGGQTFNGVSYWINYFGESLHADQHQFKFNPLDGKMYVCNDGGLYRSNDVQIGDWSVANWGYLWPTVWEDISDGMQITSFYRLGISEGNPGIVIAGAQDNSTYYKSNNSWLNIIGGDGMEAILHPTDPQVLYGSSQYGRIYSSNDGGANYDYYFTYDIWANGEEGAWTTPYWLNPNNTSQLITGHGQVYQTMNNGSFWNAISSFPNVSELGQPQVASALAVKEDNPNIIYVAKRLYHSLGLPSQLFKTDNGGSTWQDITAGLPDSLFFTDIEINQNQPDEVWVTCAGYSNGNKVFYSNDGGATWSNISKNLPNLPCNTIVLDQNTQNRNVYVGLDRGVYFTNDTATSWHLYEDNLPKVIISELEIHNTSKKLYAATFGRGIWVGNLVGDFQPSVATDEINSEQLKGFQVLPNPTSGLAQIIIPSFYLETNLEVVDVTGRIVHIDLIQYPKQSVQFELPNGLYYLRLNKAGKQLVEKLIIEN